MKYIRWALVLPLCAVMLADPAAAQSRQKDGSRRTEARQPASADRGERRRDPSHSTDGRVPFRPAPPARPRDDDRDRRDRDRRILGPITVRSPRADYDVYDRRIGSAYGYRYGYGYGGYGYAYGGRVWNRTPGMSCLRLDDELEWAHDEWHYRNDRDRHERWYDVEHARLELRIAEERAYSGCDRPREERDCDERGRFARTGEALHTAIVVLDILLGERSRDRW